MANGGKMNDAFQRLKNTQFDEAVLQDVLNKVEQTEASLFAYAGAAENECKVQKAEGDQSVKDLQEKGQNEIARIKLRRRREDSDIASERQKNKAAIAQDLRDAIDVETTKQKRIQEDLVERLANVQRSEDEEIRKINEEMLQSSTKKCKESLNQGAKPKARIPVGQPLFEYFGSNGTAEDGANDSPMTATEERRVVPTQETRTTNESSLQPIYDPVWNQAETSWLSWISCFCKTQVNSESEFTRWDLVNMCLPDLLSNPSLRNIRFDELEEVFRKSHTFPTLQLVNKLRCNVDCNSTFTFLSPLPNLVELVIFVAQTGDPSVTNTLEEIDGYVQNLSQHPTVRRLHIKIPSDVLRRRALTELVNYPVLVHCFPKLTHLSTPMKGFGDGLTHIFTGFPKLKCLHLGVRCEQNEVPRNWDAILSGIPAGICDVMRTSGNYEYVADNSNHRTGLRNLKRLRTLEIGDERQTFDFLFTELLIRRVFVKMKSLRDISLGTTEGDAPDACQPFVERLKRKGIELCRMKVQMAI